MLHLLLKWLTTMDRAEETVEQATGGGRRGGGDNPSQGKLISWHWPRMGATGTDAAGRRASQTRARRLKKKEGGGAPASTLAWQSARGWRLCCKTHSQHCQITHASPYARDYLFQPAQCFFFFFFFWFATAPIGSWTVETAARHNGNVLQDLSRCKLSAWTQLSSDIEHVKSWPELYNVSHEPLLWHPTTRQMAFTPPTTQKHAVLQDQNRRMVLPSAAVKSRSLFLTWRPIGVFLFNCLGSCLFSQATTASPGFFFSFFLSFSFFFFFFYLGIPNNFRAHAGIQTE